MTSGEPISRIDSDAGAASNDSKKRSKLGYHRTAVACSHCRRRKIRCVPSSDLPDAKCQNCIRLKKDCQFHPVDQQDVSSKKSKSGLRGDARSLDGTAIRTSPSPESSVDAPLSQIDSSGGSSAMPTNWEQTNFVTSPNTQINGFVFGQQAWPSSISSGAQGPYLRHHSLPGPAAGQFYLPTDVAPPMPYGQRQFMPMTTASISIESRPMYNNAMLEDAQYYERRPSYVPARSSSTTLQETPPSHYAQFFSGPERRQTLPVHYANHPGQITSQLTSEVGQYSLPSQFNDQNSQENMYNQSVQQQNYANHRAILLGDEQRRYIKYPP